MQTSVASVLVLCAIVAPGALGCANYSQLQDAETLPVDRQSIGVGASFTRYDSDVTDDGTTESLSVPAVMLTARRGIAERLEAQAAAWIPLGARAGLKYQVVGDVGANGLHVSIGAQVGYLSIGASSGDSDARVSFVDAYLPLYVGLRLSPSFALYGVPQYVYRAVFDEDDRRSGHVTGGTLGVAIGRRSKVYVEAGGFYDTLVDAPIVNTAIGIGL